MRLRQIEVFQAILQTGSVSAAADLLCISQPAVSKTLSHAEQQLGYALFDRIKGRLYPTPEARLLQQEVGVLFADLQRLKRLAEGLRQRQDRPLLLDATPALAHALLPATLSRWRQAFPDTPCYLATHHSAEMVQRLCLHEADIGLSLQPVAHPGIVQQALASGVLWAVAARGSWPAEQLAAPLPIQALHQQPFIGLDRDDVLWQAFGERLAQQGVTPKVLTTVQTYQLACDLVAGGHGWAVVDPFTAHGPHAAGVDCRPLTPALPVTLYVLRARDAALAVPARHLLATLQATVQGMGFTTTG